MLLKMGHFISMVSSGVVIFRYAKYPMAPQKIWGNRGQSICPRKWPLLTDNRGSKVTTCWGEAGPEEAGVLQKMGHFNARVAPEMRIRLKCRISQDFPTILGK